MPVLKMKTNGEWVTILGGGSGAGGDCGCEIDPTLSIEDAAADAKATGDRLTNIEDQLKELTYEPVFISSFTNNNAINRTTEKGDTTPIQLSWKLNKIPQSLTLDGNSITPTDQGTYQLLSIPTQDTVWTLEAIDELGVISIKTTSLIFVDSIYYGSSNIDNFNDNLLESNYLINSLRLKSKKPEVATKSIKIIVNPENQQHAVFILPKSYDTPIFDVNGLKGGFYLYKSLNIKNVFSYVSEYNVWISDNTGLGEMTVVINWGEN